MAKKLVYEKQNALYVKLLKNARIIFKGNIAYLSADIIDFGEGNEQLALREYLDKKYPVEMVNIPLEQRMVLKNKD